MNTFTAYVPLSNWLYGFDRYRRWYDKSQIPNTRYPDRMYFLGPEEDQSIGIIKARKLAERLGEPGQAVVYFSLFAELGVLEKNSWTGTGIGYAHSSLQVPIDACGLIYSNGTVEPLLPEEVLAYAYAQLRGDVQWTSCTPRSFSVLPIAQACPAACAFCFSKASASDDIPQLPWTLDEVAKSAAKAKALGAERAVITGGGEPTLLKPERLLELVSTLSSFWPKVLLISNGFRWGKIEESERRGHLAALRDAGLSHLALSRHGVTSDEEALLMGLQMHSDRVVTSALVIGLKPRVICVLQKNGVSTSEKAVQYLRRMAKEGVPEICFKELYVSSQIENHWANEKENQFSQSHQVSLGVVIETMAQLDFKETARLPWGSPVFDGFIEGHPMRVAAYTEPSVGWELQHRLVRSWNFMADGQTLASLEDSRSLILV
ncbi:MAG: radical SAM protein [Gallionellaceae bacterium]